MRSVLPDGTVLRGGYRVEFLDCGGMSLTYRAFRGGERFLVKEAPCAQPECVAALEHEYSLLCRLDHPGIVRAHAFFQQDAHCYLVLDYIEGETLDRRAAARTVSEVEATGWCLQLCDIVDYLHRCEPPIIHRDIKPLNVMIDEAGRLHLLDFGISRTYDPVRLRDTSAMGSALFAAPEQFGNAQTDARSDLFSLGATLHHLLCGEREDARQGFSFTPLRHLRPDLSPHLEAVLMRAVEMRPDDRWDCAAAMRAALRTPLSVSVTRGSRRAVSRERILAGVSCGLLGIFLYCNAIASASVEMADVLVQRRPAVAASASMERSTPQTALEAAPAAAPSTGVVAATPGTPAVTSAPATQTATPKVQTPAARTQATSEPQTAALASLGMETAAVGPAMIPTAAPHETGRRREAFKPPPAEADSFRRGPLHPPPGDRPDDRRQPLGDRRPTDLDARRGRMAVLGPDDRRRFGSPEASNPEAQDESRVPDALRPAVPQDLEGRDRKW